MIRYSLTLIVLSFLVGCGSDSPETKETAANPSAEKSPADTPTPANPQPLQLPKTSPAPPVPTFKPLSLGTSGGSSNTGGGTKTPAAGKDAMTSVLDAMKPLQVFLGQWNTTTRAKGAGSSNWVWDFRTNKMQPALVMSGTGHPYFKNVRLTFLTDKQKFQITAKDQDENQRTYQGEFTEEPHFITGDSGKPEPRFEMMLAEVGNDDARKLVGVKLSQRDKNRMWMQVYNRSGKTLRLDDNVTSQRDGTSFAVSDTDYGDRECIVSQGLGTTAVTFMGRTYYVCCSGCQAAFTDDPDFWITKAEVRQKMEKK